MRKQMIALLLAGVLTTGCINTSVSPVWAAEGIENTDTVEGAADPDAEDTALKSGAADPDSEDTAPDAGAANPDSEDIKLNTDVASTGIENNAEAKGQNKDENTDEAETELTETESLSVQSLAATEDSVEVQEALTWNVTDDARIEIRFQSTVKYANLRFAVWSAEGGQDDLTWNEAVSKDQMLFTLTFDPAKLKHLGAVHIHAYTLNTESGQLVFVEKAVAETGTPSVGRISMINLDEANGTGTLLLSDLQHPELIRDIQVPTWSMSNQADIVWYKAVRQAGMGEITYTVPFSLANHKYNTGIYHMHVYCTDTCGSMKFQTKADQELTTKQGTVEMQTTDNCFLYQAEVKNFALPGGWSEIRFAVWSAEGGQDDLKWITTKNTTTIININDYKHLGLFYVHCYAMDRNGSLRLAGTGAFTPEIQAPVVESGELSSNGSLEILVKNLQQNAFKELQTAVWSAKNGQDDLRWYSGSIQKDGTGKILVNMQNHKDAGQYYVHVYGVTSSGTMQFIGSVDDLVIEAPAAKAITVTDVNQDEGAFTVKVELPVNSLAVSKIQVPVWSASDQSDIKWYDAALKADGSYQVTVKTSNHKEHTGTYHIHVYGNYTNGLVAFLGNTSQVMNPTPIAVLKNAGSTKRTVLIRSCPNAKKVLVPVWSSDNGQDDLVWYTATKTSGGSWQAVIDFANHKNSGNYLVHVYADDAFVGNTSFNLDYSEVKTDYTELAAGMEVAAFNQQLILVAASGTSAQVTMLNKNSDGTWFQILSSAGYVGINGVGPTTEWNRKTPSGVFGFTKAFGILPDPGTAFPYVKVDQSHYWVDDVNSKYYNQFVSSRTVVPDWASAEHLIDYTGSYGYCLALDYNPDCVPGVGSAIFLHCSSGRPTAGCISVPESVMRQIMQQVRTDCKIVIDSKSGLAAY